MSTWCVSLSGPLEQGCGLALVKLALQVNEIMYQWGNADFLGYALARDPKLHSPIAAKWKSTQALVSDRLVSNSDFVTY